MMEYCNTMSTFLVELANCFKRSSIGLILTRTFKNETINTVEVTKGHFNANFA